MLIGELSVGLLIFMVGGMAAFFSAILFVAPPGPIVGVPLLLGGSSLFVLGMGMFFHAGGELLQDDYSNPKDVVNELIQKGARVNTRDNAGNTALHMLALGKVKLAKRAQSRKIARTLIDLGADTTAKNKAGLTPYDVAKEFKRVGLMATLNPTAVELRGKVRGAKEALKRKVAH